jgi:hypothetical protein
MDKKQLLSFGKPSLLEMTYRKTYILTVALALAAVEY